MEPLDEQGEEEIGDAEERVERGELESGDSGSSRRNALRKAAVASGVAAAAWVAPRVDGLSVRPDYAAAGTARGTWSFSRNNPFPGTVNYNIPTPSGNEPISATYNGGNTNGQVNVSFNNMDQPWNSNCHISGFSGAAPGGVGNVRTQGLSNNQVNWDIYNPFWGNTNTANANNLTFTVTC